MLVADDDAEFLDVVVEALEDTGADVVRACSGSDLQDALARGTVFDLVISDVSMPRITGLDVMTAARRQGLACPIVMTALRGETTIAEVAALGGRVALLHKPFSIAALRVAVHSCLGAPAHVRQDRIDPRLMVTRS